jgi:hypothetical protein
MGFYFVIHFCTVIALFTQKMKGLMGSMIQFTVYVVDCGFNLFIPIMSLPLC